MDALASSLTFLAFIVVINEGQIPPLSLIPSFPEDGPSSRLSRMYFPFVKLVIPPEPCDGGETTFYDIRSGVCLPKGKCATYRGTKAGDCAMGLGECCRFTAACNASNREIEVRREVVQLMSPTPIETACTFVIKRRAKYCAIKIDFVQFTSTSGDFNGQCINDSLTIRGSSTVKDGFQVCGHLTGQHMYLSFGKSNTIELRPAFRSLVGLYNLVVTQIPCLSHLTVPEWCLQYYNNSKGTIKSFDFPNQHQANQEYTICVGGLNGGATINWRHCSNPGTDRETFRIADPQLPITSEVVCTKERDWVQINGENRMCTFPQTLEGVTSSFTPFLFNVHFNGYEKPPLPFLDEISQVKVEGECLSLLLNKPYLQNLYTNCDWQYDPRPQCYCYPSQALIDLYGPPDANNTGFCLDYAQS